MHNCSFIVYGLGMADFWSFHDWALQSLNDSHKTFLRDFESYDCHFRTLKAILLYKVVLHNYVFFPEATFSISAAQLHHKTAILTNKLSGLWQSCSKLLIMLLMSLMLLTMPRTEKGMTFDVVCHVYQLSRILTTFCHSCCVKYR